MLLANKSRREPPKTRKMPVRTVCVPHTKSAMAASKFNIRQVCAQPDEQDLKRAVEMVKACFASDDFKEGRAAFLEKRPAQFKGR